jgi:ABC-type glycerol-3-phosphate transport system substrate-binding protein
MKRTVKAFLVFIAALALSLPLTFASASASVSRAKSLDGESVEVAAVWTGTEQKNFKRVLDAFEKKTGASTTFTSTGDDISAALEPRIAGGAAPDVAILPQPGLLNDFVQRGALKPVEDVAGKEVDANYAPIWRRYGTVNDQLYGVWVKAANKSLVWYNTSVFDDAGVKPAASFDQMLSDMQTISDFGVTPLSVGAANGWTLTDIFENIYLAQAGPDMYDQLSSHSIPWTDPSVIEALNTMAKVVPSKFIVGGTSDALQTEFTESVQNLFSNPPKGAMEIEGDFVAATISGDTKAKVGSDAKQFSFPAIGENPAPTITGGDVAVMFNDNPAARALIRYLATPEAAETWAKPGGYLSANRNVAMKAYPNATTRDIAKALVTSDNVRFDMSDLQPSSFGATDGQGEWKLFQDFLSNPSNAQGIAQELESAAARAYSGQQQ